MQLGAEIDDSLKWSFINVLLPLVFLTSQYRQVQVYKQWIHDDDLEGYFDLSQSDTGFST